MSKPTIPSNLNSYITEDGIVFIDRGDEPGEAYAENLSLSIKEIPGLIARLQHHLKEAE